VRERETLRADLLRRAGEDGLLLFLHILTVCYFNAFAALAGSGVGLSSFAGEKCTVSAKTHYRFVGQW
jgi:hypothetical protein